MLPQIDREVGHVELITRDDERYALLYQPGSVVCAEGQGSVADDSGGKSRAHDIDVLGNVGW